MQLCRAVPKDVFPQYNPRKTHNPPVDSPSRIRLSFQCEPYRDYDIPESIYYGQMEGIMMRFSIDPQEIE